jgi:hypothetical protein
MLLLLSELCNQPSATICVCSVSIAAAEVPQPNWWGGWWTPPDLEYFFRVDSLSVIHGRPVVRMVHIMQQYTIRMQKQHTSAGRWQQQHRTPRRDQCCENLGGGSEAAAVGKACAGCDCRYCSEACQQSAGRKVHVGAWLLLGPRVVRAEQTSPSNLRSGRMVRGDQSSSLDKST